MKEVEKRALELFREHFGQPEAMKAIAASGSGRRYYRIAGKNRSVIATVGTDAAENEDFFALQGALKADGIKVPDVYAVSADRMVYLQQDLGDISLFDRAKAPDFASFVLGKMFEEAMRTLPHLQTGARTVGTAALVRPPFGSRLILWDLNYFKYCFLKPKDIAMDENLLEDDFQLMAKRLSSCKPELWGFMYRDCQSRNIMAHNGDLYWIDFQGGRPGPIVYDVVSMLWQARLALNDATQRRFINVYARELASLRPVSEEEVTQAVYAMVPLRVLQTLGAYGMRGLTQRKEHFLKSIPLALRSLRGLIDNGTFEPYPELKRISQYICDKPEIYVSTGK